MTRDDIIRLREECDQWAEDHLQCKGEYHPDFHTVSDERFAAFVAAAEREACAVLCEQQKDRWVDGSDQWGNPCPARLRVTPSSCAAAIRARGQA